MEYHNLKRKAVLYKEILANTQSYRQVWQESLKGAIIRFLEDVEKNLELNSRVEVRHNVANMEAVVLTLGVTPSGMYHKIDQGVDVPLVKHNGSLVYQQLFNGKIIVLIQYPFIENYGQPKQPKTVAIYRPHELQEPFLIRHVEDFLQEITAWEDYDDDEPAKRIGFDLNIGTHKQE